MADAGDGIMDGPRTDAPAVAPLVAYTDALRRYDGARLVEVARAAGWNDVPAGRAALAAGVAEHLGQPRAAEKALAGLPHGARLAVSLLALTEAPSWPAHAVSHALACLGVEAREAVLPLLERGLLAVAVEEQATVRDFVEALAPRNGLTATLIAHPAAVSGARTVLPDGPPLPRSGPARQPRESDGLEPLLRLAAVWQRVADAPMRQTQQGAIYKRDRDRLEDDPVIAGPIADALEPLPDMPAFWLSLARGVGLLEAEPASDRVSAARPEFWPDNAYHLPQMIAARWLGMRNWHEQGGLQRDGAVYELALPYVRPAVLLWLATLGEGEWAAADDLAARLRELSPHWDKATFLDVPVNPRAGGKKSAAKDTGGPGSDVLEAILLGPAYQLGLVRAGEEAVSGRRVVQLAPLGRYLLALGPPPPPRPSYEHFLFVQPSFEVIAYRQGLNPGLIGQFSRFTVWTQIGAALALRLTPESVYRGLEGGLTAQAMLDLLARHSPRPLPSGVAESVRTWADRRERVSYYASATLVEFATPADLDRALQHWPAADGPPPVRVSDRLVLVESDTAIPFKMFRKTGTRDYRSPPEACVEVQPDGVTLTVDLARSDLLVDAELSRFADEEPEPGDRPPLATPRRRFVVSAGSLARAAESGMTASGLAHWFPRRTGGDVPPAIRLLLAARASRVPPLETARPLVLHAPPEVLDGLAQHPETRGMLGDRLGPTAVVIPDESLGPFRRAVARLGLALRDPAPGQPAPEPAPPRR